jgi:LPXTG-motif cell wall-anchored protein
MGNQLATTTLTNTWKVGGTFDTVEHTLALDTVAFLQKGVYLTGMEYYVRSSSKSYYYMALNTRSSARLYYGPGVQNGSSGNMGNVVVYYIALYNSGKTNLYMNDIQDVLPKGFTFDGMYYKIDYTRFNNSQETTSQNNSYCTNSNSTKYFQLVTPDYSKNLTTPSSFASGTFAPSVETLADGRQRVTFTLTKNGSAKVRKFGEDDDGRFYLKPGQMTAILFTVRIGDDASTENLAENTAAMPFTNYNGGNLILNDTAIATPIYYNSALSNSYTSTYVDQQEPNDGQAEIISRAEASARDMNVSKDSASQWLASSVTISKGYAAPGISKSCVDSSGTAISAALSTDVIQWYVDVYGGDDGSLTGYTISDTMMAPYKFTGTASYAIDYNSSTYNAQYRSQKANVTVTFAIPDVGTEKTYTYKDSSYTVRLDEAEDGTQTLTMKVQGSTLALPPGISGRLTVQTDNISQSYENKDYINTAYLTPTQEFSKAEVSTGSYTLYDPALDDEETALPSVSAEARVAVSYGYATTSYLTITELADSTNTGASNSTKNVISLDNTEGAFRYVLNVNNSGGVNSPAAAMSMFVLVDNLPEVDDHQTFYDEFGRHSEFNVDFVESKDDLDFQVYVTDSDGNVKVLDPSQYEVLFTEQTSFQYADNTDVWKGEDLSDSEGWFSLDECIANGTLGKMRSFRVVIKDENATNSDTSVEKLMPAKSTISVAFNAKIDEDSDLGYNEIAYNSFGYLYEVNNRQLQSATAVVGVKTPGVPYLSKKLIDASGEAFTARKDESFQFIIYKAKNQNLSSELSENEIFEKLDELGIAATKVTVDVAEGKASSELMELSNLKRYVYDEDSDSWAAGDEYFTWDDGTSYTVIELLPGEDSDFEFASVNGSQKDAYSFSFLSTSPNTARFTNERKSGAIELTKIGDNDGKALSGALFALYTTNKDDALAEDETSAESAASTAASDSVTTDLDKAEREIEVDGTTWYLKDVERTDIDGLIQWSGLMEEQYYVLELEAPQSYSIGDEPGQVVDIEFGSTAEITVTNYWSYDLPYTGGSGTMQFTLAGTALALTGAAALLYLKRKRDTQE